MALKKGFGWRRALEECEWDIFTEEILPRIPANKLVTLKSVCKNWYRIIWSPYFIGLHLKIYNNQIRIRVLIQHNFDGTLREYKINCGEETELQIPYPQESTILGSCDGLLCLLLRRSSGHHTIAVYNPSTGKYLWLQSCLKHVYKIVKCSWFGQHPCSGEYVLVLGNCYAEFVVYKFNNGTSNSNSKLEKIHSTSFNSGCYVERIGTLLHGALHWPLCLPDTVICAYHLDDNKHFEIAPPVHSDTLLFEFKLGVAEGCLFAFFRATNYASGVFELWIMKEYRVQQSWTKYANIEGLKNRVVAPLAFFPNGNDLILHPNKSELIKYTFDDNKALLLINSKHDCEAITCADSLVSPKIVET